MIESPYVGAGMFSCYFKLYEIMDVTGPFLVKSVSNGVQIPSTYADVIMRQVWYNEFMYTLFQIASLASNLCLCHDLVKTLQSPFNSADSRMTKYIIFTILGPIIVTIGIFTTAYVDQELINDE